MQNCFLSCLVQLRLPNPQLLRWCRHSLDCVIQKMLIEILQAFHCFCSEEYLHAKKQWTQKQDQVLIENYQNFASLEKKSRFTFLAELVGGGKTYKDCYNRAKLLKLKKGSVAEAKEISSNLLSKQGDH